MRSAIQNSDVTTYLPFHSGRGDFCKNFLPNAAPCPWRGAAFMHCLQLKAIFFLSCICKNLSCAEREVLLIYVGFPPVGVGNELLYEHLRFLLLGGFIVFKLVLFKLFEL